MKRLVKKTTCPICLENNITDLKNFPQYNYCQDCQTAWYKKFPKTDYSEDYYVGKSGLAQKLFSPIANFFYKIRRIYVGDFKRKVWIDVGAGEGGFLKTVKADKKIGVEVSSYSRKRINEMGITTISNDQFLKEKGLEADVISLWQVLEHTENPWDYLKATSKNLNKNGLVVIGVPNINSNDFRLFQKYWFHLAPKFHLWHFSPKSLELMLKKANLKLVKIDYSAIEHHLPGLLQSFINYFSQTEDFLVKFVKRRQQNDKLAIKGLLWSLFWLTLGLPAVILFWIVNILTHRSGTFVVVAKSST